MLYLSLGIGIALKLASTSALRHGQSPYLPRVDGVRLDGVPLEEDLRVLEGMGPANETVASCVRLASYADASDEHRNTVSQRGGIEGAARAMRRFPESPQVQAQCAWFLAMVNSKQASVDTKREVSLRAGRSGAVELAAAAMRRFPEDGDVQDGGSIMFGCMSDFTPEVQAALAAMGAPGLSAGAVRRFPGRWGIWGGLAGMASLPSTARYLYEQGLIGEALHAMRANETRRANRVRVESMCVLTQLARLVPESVGTIVSSGALPEAFQELRDEPTGEVFGNARGLFGAVGASSPAGRAELVRLGWRFEG